LGINIEQYSNISKEEFEIEIVTPLFLGGADKSKSEIRPASIK
jgi:CRISPR/Cas system CMR-associated protein Cmr1 (group 7 of RAMP superfamily)